MKPTTVARLSLTMSLATLTGCALGTTHLEVAHSPFAQPPPTEIRGHIMVKRFVDVRDVDRRPFVGAKRNGYGMVLGHVAVPKGVELETLLSGYFVEALRQAGYDATLAPDGDQGPMPADIDAVLEGEIQDFWLDLFMATWHKIRIGVRLRKPTLDDLVWERTITGADTNVLWLGLTAEFEKVIRGALDNALAAAVTEFRSAEFAQGVAAAGSSGPPVTASGASGEVAPPAPQ